MKESTDEKERPGIPQVVEAEEVAKPAKLSKREKRNQLSLSTPVKTSANWNKPSRRKKATRHYRINIVMAVEHEENAINSGDGKKSAKKKH